MKEDPTHIDKYGNKFWYNSKNQLHRDNDLPAIIASDGSQSWFQNGEEHRKRDKPAYINSDMYKAYYK